MVASATSHGTPGGSAVGLALALGSALFIGVALVMKKKGLITHGNDLTTIYRSPIWMAGAVLLAVGEVLNFVAYAFAPALLVTPVGAVSVVISAAFADVFLKEKLPINGKVACFQCLVGTVIIIFHAPTQATPPTMAAYMELALAPVFLAWTGLLTAVSVYLAVRASRARDDRNNMMRYIGVCSLIGSLSIVATQGVGPAIVLSVSEPRNAQVRHWFFWVLLAVMTGTLVVELAYLNRALGRFSAAIVTPVYYVTFTTATIVSTSIFAQGYSATPVAIASGVMGFFVICSGVYLLQVSRREQEGRAFDSDKLVLTVSASELRSNPLKAVQDMLTDFLGGDAQSVTGSGGGGGRRLSLPFHLTRPPAPRDPDHDQQQQRPQPQPGERSRRASMASVAVDLSDSLSNPPDEKNLSLAEFGKNIRIKRAVNLQTGEHANIVVPRTEPPPAESPQDLV